MDKKKHWVGIYVLELIKIVYSTIYLKSLLTLLAILILRYFVILIKES